MKKIISFVVLLVVTILVLFLCLKDNYHAIINTLISMDIKWLIVAFTCILMYWFLKTLPLYYFTKSHKNNFTYKSAVILLLRTQFVNAITPFATGGQPYQVYYLNKEGIRPSTSTSIILENFIVYQIALVLLGIIAMVCNYFFQIFPHNDLLTHLITLGFVINTLIIIVSFIVAFGKKISKKILHLGITFLSKLKLVKDKEKKLEKWNESITNFHDSAKVLMEDKKLFFSMVIVNLVALSILYMIPVFVLYAAGCFDKVNIGIAIISSAYVMLIGSFVPIPGGTGGLEYGFMKFYGFFIHGSLLSATMLIWRFITYYFGLIIGGIAFNVKGKNN